MAAFTSGKTALCTQPVSRPTRARGVPDRGRHAGTSPLPAPARCDVDERTEPFRHRHGSAERRQAERHAHAAGIREEAEEEAAHEPVAERSLELLLDGRTGALDEPVVADA